MDFNERRTEILSILKNADSPVNASKLAERFDVTRQIIVSDIAILRAMGNPVISEKRGYYIERHNSNMLLFTITCKHTEEQTIDEFYAVVDNGGKVLDVAVEHPMYGQISANLNVCSRFDAEEFIRIAKESNATQLCNLTNGIHIHTIEMPDESAYNRAVKKLDDAGILVK